jgi:uncharacterized beta-barrel protein YwiB (DUF1934 family)
MENNISFPEYCTICENDTEIKFTYSHNFNAYLHYSENLSANVTATKIKIKTHKVAFLKLAVKACKKIQKEILNQNAINKNQNGN